MGGPGCGLVGLGVTALVAQVSALAAIKALPGLSLAEMTSP